MVTGAASPYTLSLEPGSSLPTGLALVNGVMTGVPRQAGTFTFMYRVRDVNACTAVQSISVTINPACDISPVTLPAAFQTRPYNTTLTATGGTAPYTYVLTTGILPPGLSLSPSGVLSGTPTDPGNYRFTIGATIPADKNEGKIEGYHCWAEFLADGQWVPVDISEAWKNPKLADYYFDHNPANRFELTKGRDLVIDPEPESGPINFLVYPLLEMNGEVVKPETTFEFRRVGA